MVTVSIIDESKKSSTWLEAADSETKLYLPQRWLSSLTVLKEEKERKGGSILDLIYKHWVGYVTQSKVADPQGEESNDDDG